MGEWLLGAQRFLPVLQALPCPLNPTHWVLTAQWQAIMLLETNACILGPWTSPRWVAGQCAASRMFPKHSGSTHMCMCAWSHASHVPSCMREPVNPVT